MTITNPIAGNMGNIHHLFRKLVLWVDQRVDHRHLSDAGRDQMTLMTIVDERRIDPDLDHEDEGDNHGTSDGRGLGKIYLYL